ncbi:hypothetical protein GXP71_19570 [Cellulomonas sp. H30R-01]|uniref:hypothetical protein n=1 Tax=Cellulomonas sp. H30R-01 TaxID=2704467 RepID=UPI00138C8DE9|nr:hypothetical protein [Cellulomonas sp. H30R-01]QHT58064.1 hypothetical protein GXP71_19570 [Cellulomonas sp. H30R-01]
MTRTRELRAPGLRTATVALALVLAGGVAAASASRLDVAAHDRVASGTAVVTPPCDDDVTTRLVYEQAGGVDTERVDAIDVLDVDATACAGRTVAVTGHDAAATVVLSASAPLPAGASSVRLGGFAPVTATAVRSLVVTLS